MKQCGQARLVFFHADSVHFHLCLAGNLHLTEFQYRIAKRRTTAIPCHPGLARIKNRPSPAGLSGRCNQSLV